MACGRVPPFILHNSSLIIGLRNTDEQNWWMVRPRSPLTPHPFHLITELTPFCLVE